MTNEYKLTATNTKYNFYIRKVGKMWYAYAMAKDTNRRDAMAGFTSKKSAVQATEAWASWM